MKDDISIRLGVPPHEHKAAASLYCRAFQRKLSPFLGAAERAADFLASGVIEDRALVAMQSDRLVGIAGFKWSGAGLFEPTIGRFVRSYGLSAPLDCSVSPFSTGGRNPTNC